MDITRRFRIRPLAMCVLAWAVVFSAHATRAVAQPSNPVYFDDAATAVDALDRARELASIGNTDEAVRVLQDQLLNSAEKLVVSRDDPDLYVPVRDRVREMLDGDASLRERYTELMSARARAALSSEGEELVERAYLMTPAGVEAGLRIAQRQMEDARFHASWHTIAQLAGHPLVEDAYEEQRARLARAIVAYIDERGLAFDDADRSVVSSWVEAAGVGDEMPNVRAPEIQAAKTPSDRMETIDIAGLLSKPLWSVDVGDQLEAQRVRSRNEPQGVPDSASLLYMVPAVDEDSIYVNDGFTITSWNRFSLSQRWHTPIRESGTRRIRSIRGRTFNDPNSVDVSGRWVVGVMGLSITNAETDRTIVALDSRTGEVRWQSTIGQLGLESVGDGRIVGLPVIDQRAVIVTVVKDTERRRLHSIYAVAIDLQSGEPMWSRPIGSVGKLPYGNALHNGDLPTVERGVMYRSDRIGFMVAIETVTGRVKWARRFDYTQDLRRYSAQSTWGLNKPAIRDGKLYTLNPERSLLHVIDKRTGEILEQHPSVRLGSPEYVLVCDGVLVGVNPVDVHMAPLDSLGDEATYVHALVVGQPGIRGRAVVSDERLVVPTAEGVYHGRPRAILAGGAEFDFVALDRPGIVLPMDEELLVVDDRRVHTYLLWDSAREVLTRRMENDPTDASNPVTYAELAYRAGRASLVVEATDKALRAIEREPLSTRNEMARARLFSALLDMVDPPADSPADVELDDAQRRAILSRLELAASTPRERVAQLMVRGSIAESNGEPREAVDAYQRILESEELASTMHFEAERSVPADAEATHRLRSLIEVHSREIYRAYDREASSALSALSEARDPAPFEAIARKYPVSTVAPRAWREAAARYEQQGRSRYATYALGEALRIARRVVEDDDAIETEIAGALIAQLMDSGHLDRALRLLRDYRDRGLLGDLTARGSALDGPVMLEQVCAQIAARDQRPSVGPPRVGPRTIFGWALLDARLALQENVPIDRVPMISTQGQTAVFGLDGEGNFVKLWDGVIQSRESLVRFDERGALFASRDEPTVLDRSFTMRDIDTGQIVWKTESFYTLFDEVDRREAGQPEQRGDVVPRFDTPLRSNVRSTTIIQATSRDTLVAVGVSGLAQAYDLETGELLWMDRLEVNRVHAVALDGATLAVGGVSTGLSFDDQQNAGLDIAPGDHVVELLDVRTGVRMARHEESSTVRWLTLTREGDVVAGTDRAIVAYSPTRPAPIWRKAQVEDLERSMRAWALPGRLMVQGSTGEIWQLDPRTGERLKDPLLAEEDVVGNWALNRVVDLDGTACIATARGLRLFDESGTLVGMDMRTAGGTIIPPAYASDRIVSISDEETPMGDDQSQLGFELTQHSVRTCKLVSDPVTVGFGQGHTSPDSIALVDGKILISSGSLTYVIDAPSEPMP